MLYIIVNIIISYLKAELIFIYQVVYIDHDSLRKVPDVF